MLGMSTIRRYAYFLAAFRNSNHSTLKASAFWHFLLFPFEHLPATVCARQTTDVRHVMHLHFPSIFAHPRRKVNPVPLGQKLANTSMTKGRKTA